MSGKPRIVDKAGKVSFQSPAAEDVVVRATGEETDGQYDMVEITIPPGPGVTPLHVHHDNDEAIHVIAGEVTVKLGEERHVLEAGAYAMAPRGLPHTYRNSGEEPARATTGGISRRPASAVPSRTSPALKNCYRSSRSTESRWSGRRWTVSQRGSHDHD